VRKESAARDIHKIMNYLIWPNYSFERNAKSAIKFEFLVPLLKVSSLHSLQALHLRPLNSDVTDNHNVSAKNLPSQN
jgi:hypothetical protein